MREKIIMLTIFVLLFSSYAPFMVSADELEPYDHNELIQYKGYGEVMYETIVEESAYLTGQYTNNKNYVKGSIHEIKEYANFWLEEQKRIGNTCGGFDLFSKSCAGELVSSGAGYMLTVGDYIKSLFNGKEVKEQGEKPKPSPTITEEDMSVYASFMYYDDLTDTVKPNEGVMVELIHPARTVIIRSGVTRGFSTYVSYEGSTAYTTIAIRFGSTYIDTTTRVDLYANKKYYDNKVTSLKGTLENLRSMWFLPI